MILAEVVVAKYISAVAAAATEIAAQHRNRHNNSLVVGIDICTMAGKRRPPRPTDHHGRSPWFIGIIFWLNSLV